MVQIVDIGELRYQIPQSRGAFQFLASDLVQCLDPASLVNSDLHKIPKVQRQSTITASITTVTINQVTLITKKNTTKLTIVTKVKKTTQNSICQHDRTGLSGMPKLTKPGV